MEIDDLGGGKKKRRKLAEDFIGLANCFNGVVLDDDSAVAEHTKLGIHSDDEGTMEYHYRPSAAALLLLIDCLHHLIKFACCCCCWWWWRWWSECSRLVGTIAVSEWVQSPLSGCPYTLQRNRV